jgi:hypothetical protein
MLMLYIKKDILLLRGQNSVEKVTECLFGLIIVNEEKLSFSEYFFS